MTDIKGIADISGFGKSTGYENACQKMLQAGFNWLEENKKVNLKMQTYEGIYGILKPKSKDTKELSKAVCKPVPYCSGAMHQAVMSHLFFINKNGLEKWKKELKIYYEKESKKNKK